MLGRQEIHFHHVCWVALMSWACSSVALSQGVRLESLSAWVSSAQGLELKHGQELRQVRGWGGGCAASLRLTGALAVGVRAAYADLQVDQERAVEQWGWAFWQRFYGNYVRDLQSRDSSYRATLTPDQHLYITQLVPMVEFRWPQKGAAAMRVAAGAGPWFYERTLRLHEVWEKDFPQLNHVFVYDYYNHAEVRKGVVCAATLEGGVELMLQQFLRLRFCASYSRLLSSTGSAYERFPLVSLGGLAAEMVFTY